MPKNPIPDLREPFTHECRAMAEVLKEALGKPPYTIEQIFALLKQTDVREKEAIEVPAREAVVFIVSDFVRNWWDEMVEKKEGSGNGGE